MNIIFEIDKREVEIIKEIKNSCGEIIEERTENGLNGTEIVAIVVALTPILKELIMRYLPRPKVKIILSSELGSVEISSTSMIKAKKQIDAAIKVLFPNT